MVILQGGMLEEHGPFLPAFTDGVLSARLTRELAAGIVRQHPKWTEILDGKDARSYPRYVTYLTTLAQYREWIASSSVRDSVAGSRLDNWLMRRPR